MLGPRGGAGGATAGTAGVNLGCPASCRKQLLRSSQVPSGWQQRWQRGRPVLLQPQPPWAPSHPRPSLNPCPSPRSPSTGTGRRQLSHLHTPQPPQPHSLRPHVLLFEPARLSSQAGPAPALGKTNCLAPAGTVTPLNSCSGHSTSNSSTKRVDTMLRRAPPDRSSHATLVARRGFSRSKHDHIARPLQSL